jgi:hypothetical protein
MLLWKLKVPTICQNHNFISWQLSARRCKKLPLSMNNTKSCHAPTMSYAHITLDIPNPTISQSDIWPSQPKAWCTKANRCYKINEILDCWEVCSVHAELHQETKKCSNRSYKFCEVRKVIFENHFENRFLYILWHIWVNTSHGTRIINTWARLKHVK